MSDTGWKRTSAVRQIGSIIAGVKAVPGTLWEWWVRVENGPSTGGYSPNEKAARAAVARWLEKYEKGKQK